MATPATDYQSLLGSPNVACFLSMPPGIQRVLELALLQLIVDNIGSAGGGGGSGVTTGNYGGTTPSFTPSTGSGIAIDSSTGNLWAYYNGQWNELIG